MARNSTSCREISSADLRDAGHRLSDTGEYAARSQIQHLQENQHRGVATIEPGDSPCAESGESLHLAARPFGIRGVQTATHNGIRDDRMGDRECILRLLAFMTTSYRDYRANNIDAFLNQCMIDLNQLPDATIRILKERCKRAMVDCYRIFADRAFRKQKRGSPRRFPINRALFEVWAAEISRSIVAGGG